MSYNAFERWAIQPDQTPELSVVIPTYNEAERILPTLGAMAVTLCGFNAPWELIVSDDGSKDGTCELIETLGWANLRVLRHPNTGKGGAVRRGVLAARGELILFADADNSTPIEELPRLVTELDFGADIAIGSRAMAGAREENKSRLRRAASDGLRGLVRLVTGLKTQDTQCGFKLFKRDVAQDLFARQRLNGFAFDLEILYLARKCGYGVAEVPVRWFDAPGSKIVALRDGLRFLSDLGQILEHDLLGRYGDRILPISHPREATSARATLHSTAFSKILTEDA
jgi:glycosyltransferase involved in cell wall biosynthesis